MLAALLAPCAAHAQAGPAPYPLSAYARPAGLVALPDGRRIELRCEGSGGPTVVLSAGLGFWSLHWRHVQPLVARRVRVCAADRAGFGHSDPPAAAQALFETAGDLHAALHAAGIPGPYVLVGHSVGGIEMRMFAARWPDEVAAMVLVDTSIERQEAAMAEVAPGIAAEDAAWEKTLRACEAAARAGPIVPGSPLADDCMLPLPEGAPAELSAIWPRLTTGPMLFASELRILAGMEQAGPFDTARLDLGDKPLIVLSAGIDPPVSPGLKAESDAFSLVWRRRHQQLALMSRRGVERLVPGSDHRSFLTEPGAVVAAVDEVLAMLRRR
ncbi:alpha/beta hydrolase [Sphingomonas sp. LB-2]|uniref:alpha/beta fold hydrolase n=1 Tax=Sphingomonas caeni TaxID=2984949 RepID=UPI002230BDB0|nr:alpha/beta hydrolase [Sphingomonas caeni]MCW3848042.1 alpha/beta hydrolase [Sphingomonas caeni]